MYYVLDGQTPVPEPDLLKWGQWMQTDARIVGQTEIVPGEITISTVFLGFDHKPFSKGNPLFFETMIFGGPRDGNCLRYTTWEEAELCHQRIVQELLVAVQAEVPPAN